MANTMDLLVSTHPRPWIMNLKTNFWRGSSLDEESVTCNHVGGISLTKLSFCMYLLHQSCWNVNILYPWKWLFSRLGSLAILLPLRSYILTFLLSKGMATRPEDCDTEMRFTDESDWIMATGVRMLRRSQMRAERSSDPETTLKEGSFISGMFIYKF